MIRNLRPWLGTVGSRLRHSRANVLRARLARGGYTLPVLLFVTAMGGFALLLVVDVLVNKLRRAEWLSAGVNTALAAGLCLWVRHLVSADPDELPTSVRPLGPFHRPPAYSSDVVQLLRAMSPVSCQRVAWLGHEVGGSPIDAGGPEEVDPPAFPIILNPHAGPDGMVLVLGDEALVEALERCERRALRHQVPVIRRDDVVGACADVVACVAEEEVAPRSRFDSSASESDSVSLRAGRRRRLRPRRRRPLSHLWRIAWLVAGVALAVAALQRLLEMPDDQRAARRLAAADAALADGDLRRAVGLYGETLGRRPGATRASIGLACAASLDSDIDGWLVYGSAVVAWGGSADDLRRCLPSNAPLTFAIVYTDDGPIVTAGADDSVGTAANGLRVIETRESRLSVAAAEAACAEAALELTRVSALHAYIAVNGPDPDEVRSAQSIIDRCNVTPSDLEVAERLP